MEWLGHVVNFYFMEVQLIYNVVLGIQQSDSIIHVHICVCIYLYILFQILFPYRLLKDSEYSSLCYIVDPSCLSVLCMVVQFSSVAQSCPTPCAP